MSLVPRIRQKPEDFRVEEVPLYLPSGEGGHTFLWIEKRDRNTEDVVAALARAAGVSRRDVGYAGRKDRRAITRQWFSVPALDPEQARTLPLQGARVLEAKRHGHKLRTGQLRANRFEVCVRDVPGEMVERARLHLGEIERRGMPNRFGAQRFGVDGRNVERARDLLAGSARVRDRRAARFLVSALQAAVFNEVLARRPLGLDEIEAGDVAVVHASGGLFRVEDVSEARERAARFEISATGPVFGRRVLEPDGAPADREREGLGAFGVEDVAGLRLPPGLRLRGARRALRVRPQAVDVEADRGVLRLRFTLPTGSYATVFLEEVLGEVPRVDG